MFKVKKIRYNINMFVCCKKFKKISTFLHKTLDKYIINLYNTLENN